MTPKEKAIELVEKMALDWSCNECYNDWAKECALIAVDEMIEETVMYPSLRKIYWERVKNEIDKL